MKKYIWLTFLFAITQTIKAGDEKPLKAKMTVEQYIEKYAALAVEEMYRSHIPASITLAQGILESGNGNSRLATEANNHFGIKCKSTWNGKTIFEDDDAPQECFRKYDAVIDSYRDHSSFLMSNQRYAFLFDLDPKDYKSWAYGLKKAGYATNPQYPELLIAFIEKHNLHRFDEIKISEEEQRDLNEKKTEAVKSYGKPFLINEVPAIVVSGMQSYAEIALNYDLKVYQLYKYNDLQKDAVCMPGDTLFLKSKKNKALQDYYTLGANDNMHRISQRFAIKLDKLYERNRITEVQQPAVGELIYLNGRREKAPALKDTSIAHDIIELVKVDSSRTDTFIINEKVYEDPAKNIATMPLPPSDENTLSYFDTLEEKKSELSFFHTVQPGETLYGISKKYNIRVDALQFVNALPSHAVTAGQKLIINPNLPSADTKEPQPIPGIHMVRQGETLFSIAAIYQVSVEELKAINNLVTNSIFIDQRLVVVPIKESGQTPTEAYYHEVEIGQTLFGISRKYNVPVVDLRKLNTSQLDNLKPGDKIRIR